MSKVKNNFHTLPIYWPCLVLTKELTYSNCTQTSTKRPDHCFDERLEQTEESRWLLGSTQNHNIKYITSAAKCNNLQEPFATKPNKIWQASHNFRFRLPVVRYKQLLTRQQTTWSWNSAQTRNIVRIFLRSCTVNRRLSSDGRYIYSISQRNILFYVCPSISTSINPDWPGGRHMVKYWSAK